MGTKIVRTMVTRQIGVELVLKERRHRGQARRQSEATQRWGETGRMVAKLSAFKHGFEFPGQVASWKRNGAI